MSDVVVYNDGALELKISINKENIWLNQVQIAELFDTSTDNIMINSVTQIRKYLSLFSLKKQIFCFNHIKSKIFIEKS